MYFYFSFYIVLLWFYTLSNSIPLSCTGIFLACNYNVSFLASILMVKRASSLLKLLDRTKHFPCVVPVMSTSYLIKRKGKGKTTSLKMNTRAKKGGRPVPLKSQDQLRSHERDASWRYVKPFCWVY